MRLDNISRYPEYTAEENKRLEAERKKISEENPDEPGDQLDYCDILMRNKKYRKALDILIPLYRKLHSEGFGIPHIIRCLIALGEDYNEFDWVKPPVVLHLDSGLVDLCKTVSDDDVLTLEDLYDTLFWEY